MLRWCQHVHVSLTSEEVLLTSEEVLLACLEVLLTCEWVGDPADPEEMVTTVLLFIDINASLPRQVVESKAGEVLCARLGRPMCDY